MKNFFQNDIKRIISMLLSINILKITCVMSDDLPPTYEQVTAINPPSYDQAAMDTFIKVDMVQIKNHTCYEAFKEAYLKRSNQIKVMLGLIFFGITFISWILGTVFGILFIVIGLVSFFVAMIIGFWIK